MKLSQDAAIVLGLAATALDFAHGREDEAERWLRVLRMHGQVGEALQGLGVSEAPLMTAARPTHTPPAGASARVSVCHGKSGDRLFRMDMRQGK